MTLAGPKFLFGPLALFPRRFRPLQEFNLTTLGPV